MSYDDTPESASGLATRELPDIAHRTRMREAMQAYADRINSGDQQGILALFAPNAVIEDPVGSEPKRGAQIADWFADTVAFGTRIEPVVPIRGSHAHAAALVFDVTFRTLEGARIRIRSLDVCTFDADARITSLCAYWGPEDMEVLPD